MSTKAKKAVSSSASNNRPTVNAPATVPTTTLPAAAATISTATASSTAPAGSTAATTTTTTTTSTATPANSSSPSPASEQHCYCSDPRPLQSDLICSHNTGECYATHVSCLKDNNGLPFTSFLLGRSCFLCAHCVNRKGFRHPTEMECTLDSRHGCFYEKKGFTAASEAEATAATVAGGPAQSGRERQASKEKMDAAAERDRADGAHRMEDEEVEQITNGHAAHPSRRSTRTSADRDTTAAAAAAASTIASTATGHAASHNNASASSSATGADAASAAGSGGGGGCAEEEPLEPKKAKRRGIRDADKKAKGKLVPRCTSPSHFLVDDPTALASTAASASAASTAPAAQLTSASTSAASLPSASVSSRHIDKLRTDLLLSSISSMYYRPRLVHPSAADVYVSADYDRFEYPTVDALLSPLRKTSVLDEWSPLEVALFESGICSYGKDFHAISRLMAGRKSCGQCVDFYYTWKKSGHYAMWKEFGKPVRRRADSKAEQWRAVEDRMRGFSSRQDEDGTKRRRAEESEEARERQRAGDNGPQEKKAKMESASGEQQSSSVKMEEDSNVAAGGTKTEGSVPAASAPGSVPVS